MIPVPIPTYKRATFLPDPLSSVFASTDDTSAIVQSLLAQHSDWAARLQHIRQENQGKNVALNNGLKLARGESMAAGETRLRKWASIVDKIRPALRDAVKHYLASHYSKTANIHVALNSLSEARRALQKGMQECFEFRLLVKWLMTYLTPTVFQMFASARKHVTR